MELVLVVVMYRTLTKSHGKAKTEKLLAEGWHIIKEIKDTNHETYEYILASPNQLEHSFEELAVVRVVKIKNGRYNNSIGANEYRNPKVGDIGAIVYCHENSDSYEVECVGEHGNTEWLFSFEASELSIVKT
jgi:hypothetical protein